MARPPVSRITPEELAQRQQSEAPVTVLDVRGRSYRTSDSKIAGAIRLDPRELPANYQTLSHEQTIVAYCT